MKKSFGNLLLIIGVIVAALAAGESQRISRSMELGPELIGKTLHTEISSKYEELHPDELIFQDRVIEAGTVLTAEHILWLASIDEQRENAEVLVLRRATNKEVLAADEGAVGRVLSDPITLTNEPEEIPAGRRLSAGFVERLKAAGKTIVKIDSNNEELKQRKILDWPLEEGAETPDGFALLDSKLAEPVTLPVQLKTSSYVDPNLLERLKTSEVTEVSVKIPKEWSLEGWGSRFTFLLGVVVIGLGVLLKRSKASGAAVEEELEEVSRISEALVSLEGQLEELVMGSGELDPKELHLKIDPLLTGPVYTIAEGRNSIKQAHGGKIFGAVMDAFSRGERKLNRAWSAAVDGHAEESRASLAAGLPALREAREAMPGTLPPSPAGFASVDPEMPLPPDVPLTGAGHWTDEDES
jgi:hypothetical protein